MTEKNGQADLRHLDAYAPSKLVKNDVKKTSGFSQRIIPFGFALGLHGLILWWLNAELQLTRKFLPEEIITVLEFLEPLPKPKPAIEIMSDMEVEKPVAEKSAHTNGQKVSDARKIVETRFRGHQERSDQALVVYDETGRTRLPVDFVEKLDETNIPAKRFDFQNPDLAVAGTFLKRPPVIEFNPTQFEDAWRPDQDILNELLEKAVEKTTKEIKIPVPGNPTVKLVCKVSVLALGGGCGFVPNGGYGRVVAENEDDPETLSPEEDKQCQAWWEKISNTRSQREWLKTKELYELTCKKPLAKEKTVTP